MILNSIDASVNVRGRRGYYPPNLIGPIVGFIKELKIKFNAFSYFHLRHILSQNDNRAEVITQLKKLLKDSDIYCNFEHVQFLFNVVFDSLDSIGGGGVNQIQERYHTRLKNFKELIFTNKEQFNNRFKSRQKYKGVIEKLVRDVLNSKINPQNSFKNLLNPYIQTLKEYFRHNLTEIVKNDVKSIFSNETIGKSFVKKLLNLSPVTLKKVYLNANLRYVSIFELTELMEKINTNNEIQKFIIYSLLMNKNKSGQEIARQAGITNGNVINYAKYLSKLINPETNASYIDYSERLDGKKKSPYWMVRRVKISPTGYIIQMPIEKRLYLIQELNKVINFLLRRYEHPYFAKEFLKKGNQESKDYNIIIEKLVKLSRINKRLAYSECFELLYVMLEVYDYISAKSQTEIAEEFVRRKGFIKSLAKLVLQDSNEYRNRFPSKNYVRNEVFKSANEIITGTFTLDHIKNIDSFEFQQLISSYRTYIVKLETDYLIEKGYPSIDSPAFKKRVRDFKRKNLFDRYFLGLNFIRWIESLTTSRLKEIVRFTSESLFKRNILIMCGKINQNHEILRYIIYLTLKSNDSLAKIAKRSGKSRQSIRRIGKILNTSICPITNTYYLKDYENRFSRRK